MFRCQVWMGLNYLRILELDLNIRVCFASAAELSVRALREVYPKLSFGCFIKKPVKIEYLIERLCRDRSITLYSRI